jgi:hypothetical protein
MDNTEKRDIINEYKKKELEKLSLSDEKILAGLAKNKLGLKSDELSLERLLNTQDNKLIETIAEKIQAVLYVRYKSDPRKYKNPDNVVPELNRSLRAIHFTRSFEIYVTMGDTDKFLDGATSYELTELIDGYRMFELDVIAEKILTRTIAGIEKELCDLEKIEGIKIEYIKGHLNEFEMN